MIYLLFLFIVPSVIIAQEIPTPILINEFAIEPNEIVELVNRGSEPINISGWYLDDNGGKSYFTIPEGTIISPDSCLVIKGTLNLNKSSGDSIRLFDNSNTPIEANAKLIDKYLYDKSPGSGISFLRNPDGENTWKTGTSSFGVWNETDELCEVLPTPTPTPTSTIAPSPSPSSFHTPASDIPIPNIFISEIMVAPDSSGSEWIELYNGNTTEVTLLGWYVDDVAEGGSAPIEFSLTIPAHGYGVFELSSAIFNNAGDHVRILNSSEEEQEKFEYTSSKKGYSWGRKEGTNTSFCIQNPSKGSPNTSCPPITTETLSPTRHPPTPSTTRVSPPTHALKRESGHAGETVKRYSLHVTPPVAFILGLTTADNPPQVTRQRPHIQSGTDQPTTSGFPFLASGYSLLALISVVAKLTLSHVSLNI